MCTSVASIFSVFLIWRKNALLFANGRMSEMAMCSLIPLPGHMLPTLLHPARLLVSTVALFPCVVSPLSSCWKADVFNMLFHNVL